MHKGFAEWVVSRRRLAEGPLTLSGRLPDEPGFWAADGLRFSAGPRLDAVASAGGGGGIHVRGSLRTTVALECRRCLRDLPTELDVRLDLWFEPDVGPGEGDEGVFPLAWDAAELDLREPLREELLLALPEFPLCREDCAGLCPRCGADRNEGACGCRAGGGDARWDALRELHPRDGGAKRGG